MPHVQDMDRWRGRVDALEGEAGRRWHQVMGPWSPGSPPGIALLGFASDEGVRRNLGRPGAAEGPAALRGALSNLPVMGSTPLFDAGDVLCEGGDLEGAQAEYAQWLAALLDEGHLPIGLGGGHEIAYASFSGLAAHLAVNTGNRTIGIVNFDAHFDLRRAECVTSGTPFLDAARWCEQAGVPFRYCCLGVSASSNTQALFDRAAESGAVWRLDEEMSLLTLADVRDTLRCFMDGVTDLYLTVCLDVLPGAVAPGVSAPAARGVGLDVIEPLVDEVARSGKLRVADVAELNPAHDVNGRTAQVAARLIHRLDRGFGMPR